MSNSSDTDVIGRDPLDSQVGRVTGMRRTGSRWLRSRLALGLSPTPVPVVVLLVGLAIGPQGINLLSRNILSYLNPAVAAALAALGLLIGLGFDVRRPGEIRLLGAATVEAALVMVAVGGGVVLAQLAVPIPNVS